MDSLAVTALTQAHAAYAAFIRGLSNKWSYLACTIHGIGILLHPLKTVIRSKLIPALTGQSPHSNEMHDLLALPTRIGGIALTNPTSIAKVEVSASIKASNPFKAAILQQSLEYPGGVVNEQVEAKGEIHKMKRERSMQAADSLKQSLSASLLRSMDLAQEKGSAVWLTSLPIQEFDFALHKRAFQDALALSYNWQPLQAPSACACGVKFSIEHALSCPKGSFPSIRHNEIRDLTANLLTEVCNDVSIEPELQPIDGETFTGASSYSQDCARLDIAASGLWGGRFERTFLMCESSILLLPLIITFVVIESTSWRRNVIMNSE